MSTSHFGNRGQRRQIACWWMVEAYRNRRLMRRFVHRQNRLSCPPKSLTFFWPNRDRDAGTVLHDDSIATTRDSGFDLTHLGLAKTGEGQLKAHAWLRVGETVLTGAHVREEFQAVSSFAEQP